MTAALEAPTGCHERAAARRARVVELTRAGHTASQISAIIGISKRHVTRIRHETGISQPVDIRPLAADELATAKALLDDGCSYSEVARTLDRSFSTIRRHYPGRGWEKGEGASLAQFARWANYRMSQQFSTSTARETA